MRFSLRRYSLLVAALVASTGCAEPAKQAEAPAKVVRPYDVLIRGGTVVDGTGAARFRADVAIAGRRIVKVAPEGIDTTQAHTILDATGLIVAPGFIDNHAHIATTIDRFPLAENFTRQGITTIVASLHSGAQPFPLDVYANSLYVAPNVAFFAGHSWIRTRVMGMDNREPTAAELAHMQALVDSTMKQGAMGLSTGLLYVPAFFAKTEEIIELSKVAARHGGIYVTHMRNENSGLLESVRETIRIAREAGIPAQINHHKATGKKQWGMVTQSLALIDSANAEGLDVTHDAYPYLATSTGSGILFPQEALAGGPAEFAKRIADPAQRRAIEAAMRTRIPEAVSDNLRDIQFRIVASAPQYNGKTLADYARDRGLPNTVAAGIPLLIDLQLKGGFSAIYHSISEDDYVRILRHPRSMIETDGDNIAYGVGFPHPRSLGSFPRLFERYVRTMKVLTLEEAVKKSTSMPAAQLGQAEMGVIADGKFADITVFDAETIGERGDYVNPHPYPVGIVHVLVNGVPIIRDASFTGERPGRWIRGPARAVAKPEPKQGDE
ncbi:MAG: D-aminoacylase [Gemmatimonadaceae bacterium]|nr:D-aminoacylase [Gemmatimonadaceae bacterium]